MPVSSSFDPMHRFNTIKDLEALNLLPMFPFFASPSLKSMEPEMSSPFNFPYSLPLPGALLASNSKIDVGDFSPGDISVTVRNGQLIVTGKKSRETKTPLGSTAQKQEFSYSTTIPDNIDPNQIVCKMNSPGTLSFEFPNSDSFSIPITCTREI